MSDDLQERFEFPEATRKRLRAARDKLQYAPFGIVTSIANEVGVRRQFAHSVISDEDTFSKYRSEKAQKIWWCLERRIDQNEIIPVVEKAVKALRSGENVKFKVSSRMFAFLKRRLIRLRIAHQVETDGQSPATYTFIPIVPVAKVA